MSLMLPVPQFSAHTEQLRLLSITFCTTAALSLPLVRHVWSQPLSQGVLT